MASDPFARLARFAFSLLVLVTVFVFLLMLAAAIPIIQGLWL